jgi:hypothetical protein
MAEKFEISKDGYLSLIKRVFDNKLEERELALDRYRKADDQMENAEQFVLMGKNAVAFLNLASVSTNDLASLAKEIKSIVYKDEIGGDINLSLPDNWKEAIQENVEEAEKRRTTRSVDTNDSNE